MLRKFWAGVVLTHFQRQPFIISGVQRIFRNVSFNVHPELLADQSFTLESIGYTNAKMRQLIKAYFVLEDVHKAKIEIEKRISKRKYGSASIRHHGIPKKNVPSDFCMNTTTVTVLPTKQQIYIHTHWRSMEAIKRGRADLIFLRDHIYRHFDYYPTVEITFSFVGFTCHPMFFLLLTEDINWRKFLHWCMKYDKKLAEHICIWLWRYLIDPSKSYENYSSAHQVVKIAQSRIPTKTRRAIASWVDRRYDRRKGWRK